MAGVGIQVSKKPGSSEPPLINIQGDTPEEFEVNYRWVTAHLNELVQLRTLDNPPPEGIELIKSELGGVVIHQEYEPAPMPAYPNEWPSQAPNQGYGYTAPQGPVSPSAPIQAPRTQEGYSGPQGPSQGFTGPMQQTYCGRCKKAPVCADCNVGLDPTPKPVKNGQYYVHDHPNGVRDHKTHWCNEPKSR